jgi:hypothetical protein
VFLKYRQRRGTKTGVLPDFFVGAHAAIAGIPLLTRDVRRYSAYFPSLKLITPEQPGKQTNQLSADAMGVYGVCKAG